MPDLRGILIECSWTDDELAELTGHMSPSLLLADLAKLKTDTPVYVIHRKPGYEDEIEAELRAANDDRLRYVPVERGLSIGEKRNRACRLARGSLIAQWDDDDWYAPHRLRAQIAPILAGEADITGLQNAIFFELESWAFWRCTPLAW